MSTYRTLAVVCMTIKSCVTWSFEKTQRLLFFIAIWENTARFQWIRCSPKGSHLIYRTSVVFSPYRTQLNTFSISSHTHWLFFHYDAYVDISQYRTPLYYMYTYKLYSKWMLLNVRRRFTTLWSSVMSVDCTLLCAVEIVGQTCEKIQTAFIFVLYGKIQHMTKE